MTQKVQQRAKELFTGLGWPTTNDEAWRRTDLSRLLPKNFLNNLSQTAKACTSKGQVIDSGEPLPEAYSARIVLNCGQAVEKTLSRTAQAAGLQITHTIPAAMNNLALHELDCNPDRLTAWHWNCLTSALVISLPAGKSLVAPIVIEENITCKQGEYAVPHLHVEAGTGSGLNVIWTMTNPDNSSGNLLVNAGLTAHAAANSNLHLTIRQNLQHNIVFFLNGYIQADRDACISLLESHVGGQLVKTRIRAVLNGEGADARLKGLYVANDKQHIDLGTIQEHRKPHTTSDALYKGAVNSGGRSIYAGLIKVAPNAAKTDAYLTNRNLLLGNQARADSLPQLNIETNDVKCSHGSTTGRLNEYQLFYLQSRGFSRREAEQTLIHAFLAETLSEAAELETSLISRDIDCVLIE